MAKKRISVKKIKEILRLRLGEKRSLRETAQSVNTSPSVVHDCVKRFEIAGLKWPDDANIDEVVLQRKLCSPKQPCCESKATPDFATIHKELRKKGVTLYLLWQEYKQCHPDDGYQYSQFNHLYRCYRKTLSVTMRQVHKAGDKAFVDWSGDGIEIVDPETGEIWEAPLFVGVLGASGYTFAQAAASRQKREWISCHISMYEYFRGVPAATVPDNEKTGVKHPCLYDPDLNPSYAEMARYYNTAVIPTRMRKPRDKALVENGVLNAQRWIVAALRKHVFFSLSQANEAIFEKREIYNQKKYQRLDESREQLFEQLDLPLLRPLPKRRYEYGEWSSPKVNIDYHVDVDKHCYSVPYQLVGERVEARSTYSTVELFFKGKRVASHCRSYVKGGTTTQAEHMPESHREYMQWTPSRIINWAAKTGPCTGTVAERILASKRHPEQGYRACLGVKRLGEKYGQTRLETASERALLIGSPSYKTIKSILEKGLDKQTSFSDVQENKGKLPEHDNIRGPGYYN